MGYSTLLVQLSVLGILVWGINWQVQNDPRTVASANVGVEAAEIPQFEASSAYSVAPIAELTQTTTRPLFSETRRIADSEPTIAQLTDTATPPPMAEVGSLILSAIVIVDDQRAVLLTDPENGQLTRLTEGEDVAGWSLDAINPDGVVLTNSGRRKEVKLRQYDQAGERSISQLLRKNEKKRRKTTSEPEQPSTETSETTSSDEVQYCGLSRC